MSITNASSYDDGHGNYGDEGEFYLECDDCSDYLEGPFDTFEEALDYVRSNGWSSHRENGEWENRCPKCTELHQKKSYYPDSGKNLIQRTPKG